PTPQEAAIFDQAIADLKAAFDAATTAMGLPLPAGRLPGFGFRSLLLMPESPTRDSISEALREVGFTIDIRNEDVDPWSVPPSERPDLVVIGTDLGADPLTLARYWAAATPDRPRAVVLADPTDRHDRPPPAAAGGEAVVGPPSRPRAP